MREALAVLIEAIEPALRAHPEPVLGIDEQRVDAVVEETRWIAGLVREGLELARGQVVAEDTRIARPDPEDVVLLRMPQGADVPAADALLADDAVGGGIPGGQAAAGPDPQDAGAVLFHVPHEAVGKRACIGDVVLVDLEAGAVVAVQAVLGRQPDVAAAVLEDVHDRGLGEALLE